MILNPSVETKTLILIKPEIWSIDLCSGCLVILTLFKKKKKNLSERKF